MKKGSRRSVSGWMAVSDKWTNRRARAEPGNERVGRAEPVDSEAAALLSDESLRESQIRERLVRLEMKIDAMADLREVAEVAKDSALQALHIGDMAHRRLDEITDHQRWLWRSAAGAILAAAVTFITRL